jgi:cytochrome c-type biogenesis protein CcmE
MSLTVTGTIERINIGPGTWALKSDEGKTYEIYQGAPSELLQAGQNVKVKGQVRDDIMTMAAIGPVLEVKSFEIVK